MSLFRTRSARTPPPPSRDLPRAGCVCKLLDGCVTRWYQELFGNSWGFLWDADDSSWDAWAELQCSSSDLGASEVDALDSSFRTVLGFGFFSSQASVGSVQGLRLLSSCVGVDVGLKVLLAIYLWVMLTSGSFVLFIQLPSEKDHEEALCCERGARHENTT